ncbi:MAG: ROK family protein, partial [Betaproteobacteria bacterium]|nr:ROK family protein [Betaproteobacteria bacterium]
GLAGEWGHVSLPWPRLDWGEVPGPLCWCSRRACIECFLSGPALAREIGRTDANVQAALTDPRDGAGDHAIGPAFLADRHAEG